MGIDTLIICQPDNPVDMEPRNVSPVCPDCGSEDVYEYFDSTVIIPWYRYRGVCMECYHENKIEKFY